MYICIDVNPGQDHLTKVHDSGVNMYDICMTYMNLKCSKKCPSSTVLPVLCSKECSTAQGFLYKNPGRLSSARQTCDKGYLDKDSSCWSNQHLWSVDRSWSKTYHTTQSALFVIVCLWSLFCVTVPKWRHCMDRETVERMLEVIALRHCYPGTLTRISGVKSANVCHILWFFVASRFGKHTTIPDDCRCR